MENAVCNRKPNTTAAIEELIDGIVFKDKHQHMSSLAIQR